MTRRPGKPRLASLVRRLRPSPASVAAAAALQDPSLLLHLQAARRRVGGDSVRTGSRLAPTSPCRAR
jgi:hypothetical protein